MVAMAACTVRHAPVARGLGEAVEATPEILRDPDRQAEWLRAVRQAASADGYPLVINARVDVFLEPYIAEVDASIQRELVADAVRRARAYLDVGVDCVYPIALWQPDALRQFMAEVRGPVNITRVPEVAPVAELAALGVARVSWALFLYWAALARFEEHLAALEG